LQIVTLRRDNLIPSPITLNRVRAEESAMIGSDSAIHGGAQQILRLAPARNITDTRYPIADHGACAWLYPYRIDGVGVNVVEQCCQIRTVSGSRLTSEMHRLSVIGYRLSAIGSGAGSE